MRSALLVLIGLSVTTSAQADLCTYAESQRPPVMLENNYIELSRSFRCEPEAEGTLSVKFFTISDTKKKLVGEKLIKVRKKRTRGTRNYSARVRSKEYCINAKSDGRGGQIRGLGTQQRVTTKIKMLVEVKGEGDLKHLSWSEQVSVSCPKCTLQRYSSFRLTEGRGFSGRLSAKKSAKLVAKAPENWFQCARGKSWIDFRLFDGRDGKPGDAIRPAYVLSDLQKKFVRKGKQRVLSVPVPYKDVCRAVGKGRHRLNWEVVGYGELSRLGNGGRSRLTVDCP